MGKDWGSIKTIQKMVGKDAGGKADTQQTWRKWTYIMHKGAPQLEAYQPNPNQIHVFIWYIIHPNIHMHIYIWQIHLFTILIWYTLYIYYTHNYVL